MNETYREMQSYMSVRIGQIWHSTGHPLSRWEGAAEVKSLKLWSDGKCDTWLGTLDSNYETTYIVYATDLLRGDYYFLSAEPLDSPVNECLPVDINQSDFPVFLTASNRGKDDAVFSVHPDKNSVDIRGFNYNGVYFTVASVIQYNEDGYGFLQPGAGQKGVFGVLGPDGKKYLARIRDYKSDEGDWRIVLEDLREF